MKRLLVMTVIGQDRPGLVEFCRPQRLGFGLWTLGTLASGLRTLDFALIHPV